MATPAPIELLRREGRGEFNLLRRDKASLAIALDGLGIQVRFNLRTNGHEWNEGDGWIPANDRRDDEIRERVAARFTVGEKRDPARYSESGGQRA